jgi:hypothetical protein
MIKGIKKGFQDFGHNISLIVNSILLSFVYFVGVGPTSLLAKLVGKDFLEKKIPQKSYWSKLDLEKQPEEEYYRQF